MIRYLAITFMPAIRTKRIGRWRVSRYNDGTCWLHLGPLCVLVDLATGGEMKRPILCRCVRCHTAVIFMGSEAQIDDDGTVIALDDDESSPTCQATRPSGSGVTSCGYKLESVMVL